MPGARARLARASPLLLACQHARAVTALRKAHKDHIVAIEAENVYNMNVTMHITHKYYTKRSLEEQGGTTKLFTPVECGR